MSGISNEELVRKGVITADALAVQGKLNPAQSDKFIDFVIQETVLKDSARIVKFRNESLDIDKIGVSSRAAVPKAEAQDPNVRRGVNTSKVTLTPSEIMVPFEIGDVFKDVNIEGDGVEEHVIQMMAKQLANDLELLYMTGDTNGEAALQSDLLEGGDSSNYVNDSYLALQDGWARLSDGGNLVDLENQNIGLSVFSKLIRAMPTKFRRDKRNLRFYTSPDLSQIYAEKLATRATIIGDDAVKGNVATPFGIPIVEVPLWGFQPRIVEHIPFTGSGSTVSLRYGPIANLVVTVSTLAGVPTAAYILTTDYTVDETAGTVTHAGGGSAIGTTETVKHTYDANPQVLLTHMMNFIVGIGRDIRIEKDRDIFKGVNQYAITAKVAVEYEEDTAIVKGFNIGTSI